MNCKRESAPLTPSRRRAETERRSSFENFWAVCVWIMHYITSLFCWNVPKCDTLASVVNCILIYFSYYYHCFFALGLWTDTKVTSFFVLRIGFHVASMQTKFCWSCLRQVKEFYNFIVLCVVSSKSHVNIFVSTTLWSVNILKCILH